MADSWKKRRQWLAEHQIKSGGTYETATEIWNGAEEIADTFIHDGVNVIGQVSDGEIQDAIADYKAIKQAGL